MVIKMGQEFIILLKSLVVTGLFIIIDYRWYKWVGMSPIFGALKEEENYAKIRNFSFNISVHVLIFGVIVFLFEKFTGKISSGFSLWTFIGLIFLIAIILNIFSRIAISIHLRKGH
jgi:hypothetical protein